MTEEYDFLVLGGGSAGYAAARTAANHCDRVAVVDGSEPLGGLCILRGCMPSKTLLYAAEILHLAQHGVSASKPGFRTSTQSRDLKPGAAEVLAFRLRPESPGETLKSEGRVVVRGIRFDSDSAQLKPESEVGLRDLLKTLQSKKTSTFQVEGHTDSEGAEEYNLQLSQRRAEAVVHWFRRQGIAPEKLRSAGHGEGRPVSNNSSETGRALNRRVEIVEVPK